MKSFKVLQRLAKQAVDYERQALQVVVSEIEAVEADIENRLQAIEREASASLDFMTSGATLNAFTHAGKIRIGAQRERLRALQQAYEMQIERLRQQRVEQKRYDLLIERREKQAALEAAAKEQKTIDELVTMSDRRR